MRRNAEELQRVEISETRRVRLTGVMAIPPACHSKGSHLALCGPFECRRPWVNAIGRGKPNIDP